MLLVVLQKWSLPFTFKIEIWGENECKKDDYVDWLEEIMPCMFYIFYAAIKTNVFPESQKKYSILDTLF